MSTRSSSSSRNDAYLGRLGDVLSVEEVRRLQIDGVPLVFLDVRTAPEFEIRHLRGARHLPLARIAANIEELKCTDETLTIVVCKSGHRALRAQRVLTKNNVRNVHVLGGGMTAWKTARLPMIENGARIWQQRIMRMAMAVLAFAAAAFEWSDHPVLAGLLIAVGGIALLSSWGA